jgi:hypothetical protein
MLASRSRRASSANGELRASFLPFLTGEVTKRGPLGMQTRRFTHFLGRHDQNVACGQVSELVKDRQVETNGGKLPGTNIAASVNCSE